MRKTGSKKRSIIAVLIVLSSLLLTFLIWIGISLGLYLMYFGGRFESPKVSMNHTYQFDGLERTRYEITSDEGQTVVGYMYSAGTDHRGIIVFAHGYGYGGHNSYMESINYLAQNGYYVFAYDVTGNDESGGAGIGGVPQGMIDLNYVISFVEDSGNFPDLPIGLFGHSWGGYSVCSVLYYHPEVEAVIDCSGPASSADLIEGGGQGVVGALAYVVTPVIKVYERIKFGEYAIVTGIDGVESTDAEIMIIHSSDDKIVPVSYGYDIYYSRFADDPRFTFVLLNGKGHNSFLNVRNNKDLYESFVDFYDKNM